MGLFFGTLQALESFSKMTLSQSLAASFNQSAIKAALLTKIWRQPHQSSRHTDSEAELTQNYLTHSDYTSNTV